MTINKDYLMQLINGWQIYRVYQNGFHDNGSQAAAPLSLVLVSSLDPPPWHKDSRDYFTVHSYL